jgi:hypothetical protein
MTFEQAMKAVERLKHLRKLAAKPVKGLPKDCDQPELFDE